MTLQRWPRKDVFGMRAVAKRRRTKDDVQVGILNVLILQGISQDIFFQQSKWHKRKIRVFLICLHSLYSDENKNPDAARGSQPCPVSEGLLV